MAVVDRDGRLVGREAALGMAGAALDDALAGVGQLLLITGEPGIGKSALLAEIARQATARGARVLRGVCWDGAGAPPWWPWIQVLRGIDRDAAGFGEAGRLLAGQSVGKAASVEEAADARWSYDLLGRGQCRAVCSAGSSSAVHRDGGVRPTLCPTRRNRR